ATSAQLKAPQDVFIDSSDNIYILEDWGAVRKITTGGVISTIAGCPGVCGGWPSRRIAVDAAGALYIAQLDRVRKVGANGIITTIFGNGAQALGGDGGPPGLNEPYTEFLAFALDPAGGFYISGRTNIIGYRILKVTP